MTGDGARGNAGAPHIPLSVALEAVERVEKRKLAEVSVSQPTNQILKETTNDIRDEIEEAAEPSDVHADEILADCPDCEFGGLKAERVGLDGEERILRCSYVECGRVVKSYQDEWPDNVSPQPGGRRV